MMNQDARAEQRFVERQALIAGVPVFSPGRLSPLLTPKPRGETFFILGSGASVEELTDSQFSEIGRHRSVGINNWPVHPFVPDIYSFESVPGVGDGRDLGRALQYLARKDIIRKKPAILVLRPKFERELNRLENIPQSLADRTFFYGRISPATRQVSNLEADVGQYCRSIATRRQGVLFDSGASAVRMAFLGLVLGYRNLVFVGVDLSHTQYFWEKNPAYLKNLVGDPPVNNQTGTQHETLLTHGRPFSALDMIEAISGYVTGTMGGTVAVSSTASALSAFLPLFRWEGKRA